MRRRGSNNLAPVKGSPRVGNTQGVELRYLSDVSRRTRVRVPRDWPRDWARVELATLTHVKGANEW